MSDLTASADTDDRLLAAYLKALEEAANRQQVVDDFCRRHPHLTTEFRSLEASSRMLEATSAPAEPQHPRQLGEFRIIRWIGRGGMGDVYEAFHDRLKRRVAVKVIRQGPPFSAQAIERFLHEQQVLAQLHQTNIVAIYSAGEEGPHQYFAMPFVEGAALHHVVRTAYDLETSVAPYQTPSLGKLAGIVAASGPADAPTKDYQPDGEIAPRRKTIGEAKLRLSVEYFRSVAQVLVDTAEALHHAHTVRHQFGTGILHCDVKPSNIMVDSHGNCSIIDFGLGVVLLKDREKLASEPDGRTAIVGTRQYMAPEQYAPKEKQLDARTDVWGLGVTLYELLTLHRAFDEESEDVVQEKILSTEPPSPQMWVVNVPADLASICRKAMRKLPGERYATAQDFAADLRRWLRLEPTVARPAQAPRRALLWVKRNPGWATALTIAGLAFLVFVTVTILLEKGRTAAATLRADKARAEQKVAEHEATAAKEQERLEWRESRVQQSQRLRLTPHRSGWSKRALALVGEAADVRKDMELQAQAVATLAGLDAEVVKRFQHAGAHSLAFDSKGKKLLLGGTIDRGGQPKEPARLWDSTTDRILGVSEHGGAGPVAFRSDGTPLHLVPRDSRTLLLYDVGNRRLVREFKLPLADPPEPLTVLNYPTMELAADGTLVAVSTCPSDGNGHLFVWADTGKLLARIATPACALAFSPDAAVLAGGDREGRITLWSIPEGKQLLTIQAGYNRLNCLALAPDPLRREGNFNADDKSFPWLLAAGDAGGTVTIWDLQKRLPRSFCRGSHYQIEAVALSPDATTLASSSQNQVRLWDVATGRLLLDLEHEPGPMAFTPDGHRLAVGGSTQPATVYELEERRGIQTLRGLAAEIAKVKFSPDDRQVAALSHDWQVGVWEAASGRLRHVFEVPKGEWADNGAFVIDPAGRRIAFAAGTQASLRSLDTGKELGRWRLPLGFVDLLAFNADGKLLSFRVETKDGKVLPYATDPVQHPRVCRLRVLAPPAQAQMVKEIVDFNWHVYCAATPFDGRYIAVEGIQGRPGSFRRIAKVFDGISGRELFPLRQDRDRQLAGWLLMDPPGKILGFFPDNSDAMTLVEIPSGRLIRTIKGGAACLGPGGEYVLGFGSFPTGAHLFSQATDTPLINLGIDFLGSPVESSFSSKGDRIARGHADGTVAIYDLPIIRRRLAQVGLEW